VSATHPPQVVVLGAGFAGLTFCQSLRCPAARVTLVDRQNHHLFQPLLYQVAAAGLSAPEIAQPIRAVLHDQPNLTVLLAEVTDLQLGPKRVILGRRQLSYDYLVVALGGVTSYFGHPEWEEFAPGLKSLDDALRLRARILLAFEQAENATDIAEQGRLMTIVVIGGGPTGVELAGAFAELARTVLRRDFRRINPAEARILLIEGGSRLLPAFSPDLSERALDQLRKLGVEVRLQQRVRSITPGRAELESGEVVSAGNIVWAAGVAGSPVGARLGVERDREGRVKVGPDLTVPGHPEVFVLGDLAVVPGESGRPVPGVCPAAMQMGRYAAQVIRDEIASPLASGRRRAPFRYCDRGSMATIGRSAAVAEIRGLKLSGLPAWLSWLGVHLIFLIGFRNRLAVLLQWAYSYFTYRRGARLITGAAAERRPSPPT
jgi:NADH dehydrogenase